MGRMFSFITETWNPIAGSCPYGCSYCWAKGMIKRYNYKKYQGSARLDEKAMKKIPNEGFIFVQDMSDISTLGIEDASILIGELADHSGAQFLLLTKNPRWYKQVVKELGDFPFNVVLGATIETNRGIPVSLAPPPIMRFDAMYWVSTRLQNETFICVEPIMDFDEQAFRQYLNLIHPSFGIAIGYDNYHNHLPEPSLEKTNILIKELEECGNKVFRKTLRERVPIRLLEGNK